MNKSILKAIIVAKSLVVAAVFSLAQNAYAYDTAKLQVDISGAQKNKYFLCVSSVGCVRLDSIKGSMPINQMDVRYIFMADAATYQMYPQALPSSCNVTVNGNQKLVVKGNIAKAANNKTYIANLHCSVS